jgi:hypothetical protein
MKQPTQRLAYAQDASSRNIYRRLQWLLLSGGYRGTNRRSGTNVTIAFFQLALLVQKRIDQCVLHQRTHTSKANITAVFIVTLLAACVESSRRMHDSRLDGHVLAVEFYGSFNEEKLVFESRTIYVQFKAI